MITKYMLILRSLAMLTASGSVNMKSGVRKCDYSCKEISQNLQDERVRSANRANQPEIMAIRTDTTAGVAILCCQGLGDDDEGNRDGARAGAVTVSSRGCRRASARYQACAPWGALAFPRRRRTATSKPPTVANMASMPGSGTSSASSCAAAKPCRASAVATLMPRSRAT